MTKYGQHFLTDKAVLRSMLDVVAAHGSHNTIVEIGPGQGVLTKELAHLAKRVVSIEIDRTLGVFLDPLAKKFPNVEVVYGDALNIDWASLGLKDGLYSVASNLPYEISGAILRQMLTKPPYPSHIALLIQKEVAERVTAKPGDLSILGLSVQAFSQPRIVRLVGPGAFNPKPKVDSALISLEHIRDHSAVAPEQEKIFFRLVKAGFAQKRKLLRANLQNIKIPKESILDAFAEVGLPQTARAQELSLQQWVRLVDKLDKFIV